MGSGKPYQRYLFYQEPGWIAKIMSWILFFPTGAQTPRLPPISRSGKPPQCARQSAVLSGRPTPALASALSVRGIRSLYSHQTQAWESARNGENVVLATGTASGKTFGYNLPVLTAWLENPDLRRCIFSNQSLNAGPVIRSQFLSNCPAQPEIRHL